MNEEPLRGFIHGSPGICKSRVISGVCRLFTEALEWKHGVEFLCVAFQNRVAHAVGGTTLHAAGDIPIGGNDGCRALVKSDVDIMFTRNQHLHWLIFDECFMIADELFGHF